MNPNSLSLPRTLINSHHLQASSRTPFFHNQQPPIKEKEAKEKERRRQGPTVQPTVCAKREGKSKKIIVPFTPRVYAENLRMLSWRAPRGIGSH